MSVKMAELLFPEVKERPEDIEKRFPKRELAPGARVTRLVRALQVSFTWATFTELRGREISSPE